GGTLNMSFSRIVGNNAGNGKGMFVSGGVTATVQNNWWGCNGGPAGVGCDDIQGPGTKTSNPWIVLTNTASPNPIQVNQTTTLTADFLHNSAGTALSASNIDVLIGLPISFGNAVRGTLSGAQ